MFERLALKYAAGHPASIAMSWFEGEASFDQLSHDVSRVANALFQLRDLLPSVVAIGCVHPYRHWVFILALARLGIPSASLPGYVDANFHRSVKILSPDIILLDEPVEGLEQQVLVLNDAWFEHVSQTGAECAETITVQPDDVVRFSVAGGTSQDARRIALTSRYVETAVYHLLFQDVLSHTHRPENLRVLPTLGAETSSGFLIILSALVAGTRLQMMTGSELGLVFSQDIPTVAVVSPRHVEGILSQLPPGMSPLDNLFLTVAGGKLPRALCASIRQKLTPNVQVVYGADECGVITIVSTDAQSSDDEVGKPLPWVGLEIVDENHHRVSAGEVGRIRVSGTGVIGGYDLDPVATAVQFRDGWFYPGDTGFVDANGTLHLRGRADDLISFGGDKFDLERLDARLLACAGVKDGAMFVVPDDQGLPTPWVALITEDDFNLELLSKWMRQDFPNLPDAAAVWIDALPRTENGQPDRVALQKAVKPS
ncbi:acyl-coenzyme A synthetase/AMP-(fatty) acid ligase [Gluconobacter cerinus]|uniref:AMP-binding protein n=1 Tax=Gluconobacter cerinus TaxID=38307 RepID=UPI0022278416|nr:AMP-binding protein [Gluconobacter cerinus]MCW2264056.1 acyl-coenzyme A synthetase/AMP-(fatty) acid ligase [Gluconobacter cerinus]